jgi:hypothetical protein
MTEHTLQQFGDELKSFRALVLINIIFGAFAMAFGMQNIIATLLEYAVGEPPSPVLSAARILISVTGICIGFFWIRTSAKISRGIRGIRNEYRNGAKAGSVPAEILTGWIVAMLAHYRENRTVIQRMTLIGLAGGLIFLALGVANFVQGSQALPAAPGLGPTALAFSDAALATAAADIGIGLVAISLSRRFVRYSDVWDLRLKQADEGEESLKKALESR